MSHFVGLCFGEYWKFNLDQYDENMEVEPYIKYTKDEAIDEIKRRHAQNYKNALEALKKKNLDSERYEYFQKIIDKGLFISYEDAWAKAKDLGYEIDSDENLLSTYNPNSKWDWWVIGGRWSGYLVLKERAENGDIIKVDQADFNGIDWDYMFNNDKIPFCYVCPDGDWCEKGRMGWWAMVSDEMSNQSWEKQFKDFINSIDYNCIVTVVDFHI